MNTEARLVMMLDRYRESGWTFTPNSNGEWHVYPPENIRRDFGLNDQPIRGHQGLVEALSFVTGVEQALGWMRFGKPETREDKDADKT